MTMYKIAILSSGSGDHFQSLIEAKKANRLKAELCCLITDKADCGAAQKARANGVRVYYFDPREVDPKVYDEQVMATLDYFSVDQAVLDGYDRSLTPLLAEKYEDRLVNVDSNEAAEKFVKGLMEAKILAAQ
jgi:phosphoribosylglycinamide formyltransferase 1